jgi:hypothetical protein
MMLVLDGAWAELSVPPVDFGQHLVCGVFLESLLELSWLNLEKWKCILWWVPGS